MVFDTQRNFQGRRCIVMLYFKSNVLCISNSVWGLRPWSCAPEAAPLKCWSKSMKNAAKHCKNALISFNFIEIKKGKNLILTWKHILKISFSNLKLNKYTTHLIFFIQYFRLFFTYPPLVGLHILKTLL